jgi:phage terminase small subunit
VNEKQKLFVKHYLLDLNATKAAIAVGYSEKTAKQQGSRLLTNVDIKAEIEQKSIKRAEKLDLSAEKVLGELSKLAFSNMLDYIRVQDGDAYVDLSSMTREQAAAIQELTVEEYAEGRGEDKRDVKRTRFKLAEKRGALELLGKHLKLFTAKTEIKGLEDIAAILSKARARANVESVDA